jgi:hypothetical protein
MSTCGMSIFLKSVNSYYMNVAMCKKCLSVGSHSIPRTRPLVLAVLSVLA